MLTMDDALRKGLADIAARRYETAHGDAIERIRADVHDPAAYYVLARIGLEHRNYAKAGELFAKAHALAPGAALYAADCVLDMAAGVALAREVLGSGTAWKKWRALLGRAP
jgi:anthranilate phosphoribosyltransferase